MKKCLAIVALASVVGLTACGKASEAPREQKEQSMPDTTLAPAPPLVEFAQRISSGVSIDKLAKGESIVVPLKVKNTSKATWVFASGHHVHPYYFWLDSSGAVVGSGASYFLKDVGPGESVDVQMQVRAPEVPGKYTLRISLVQENVGFFDKKGATPLEMAVEVK